jgi:hypothetical protein
MTFYKIIDWNMGLFSCGGVNPRFSKIGKTWNNIGHLKCHLKLAKYKKKNNVVILEYNSGFPEYFNIKDFLK